jgi:hypothetical protein
MLWPITADSRYTAPHPRLEQIVEVHASPVNDYLRDPLGAFQDGIELCS